MAENQSDAAILKDVAEGNLGAQPQTMTKKGLLQRICIGSAIVCSNFVTPVVQRFGVRAQKLIFQQMSSDPFLFTRASLLHREGQAVGLAARGGDHDGLGPEPG